MKRAAIKKQKKTAKKTSQVAAKKKAKKTKKKSTKKKSKKKTKAKAKKKAQTKTQARSLVIVESPSKAKTLKKYLGRNFQVVACNGHIKDLPKSKLGVDVKKNFATDIVPISGKAKVIDRIKELSRGVKEIYLAPDPDREGEAIAYHLAEEIGKRKKIYRVLFNAVTKEAVRSAVDAPQELDPNKYYSQQTRRILDRLVGYKISPILWDKVQRGLSAGRVQSVALRIIVEREKEIRAFNPEQWFSIHAKFKKKKILFEGKYYGADPNKKVDLTEEDVVKKILKDIADNPFEVSEIRKRERRQNATPPFTTSKLQQEAANKLGFSSKKTMMLAQKLYEGIPVLGEGPQGLITYMRTDSVRTEPSFISALRDYIQEKYGPNFLPPAPYQYKKKGKGKVQDAHEAIRPTNLALPPQSIKPDLTADEFKLYSLIWNKFISSQMASAILDQTTVIIVNAGHYFRINGSIVKFEGFRAVYSDSKVEKALKRGEHREEGNEKATGLLPSFKEGEMLKPLSPPSSEEHWTSPPPRYNDASIVKDLEEKGIGRPSTYASIISNIVDRGYVEKLENRYHPTELGEVVCQMLIESFPREMEVTFTANMEEKLDLIEEGEVKYTKVLKEFWKKFEVTLEKAKNEMKNLKKQEIPTDFVCTKCHEHKFLIKWGRNGQFLTCANYPDCNGTEDFKRKPDGSLEIVPKQYFWENCPTCAKRLVVKKGRYGRFLTCEDYPNCKTTLSFYLNVKCPSCRKGYFAEKVSRYGRKFYGCNRYPDCDYAMWLLPTQYDCPECRNPVMGRRTTKRLGDHLQCPDCKAVVPIEETPFHETSEASATA
ncbi:MAG: type I DNA topoisomerase [Bacteriovoracales bacterium]|nr:type I DNA topoisomerase [Bacteriovoracales bacterium]